MAVGTCRFCGRGVCENHVDIRPYVISLDRTATGVSRAVVVENALHCSVCDETGTVRRHINLFVNTNHMRDRNGLDTPLAPGDVVTILPAVSGG